MKTIDETIAHAREVAERNRNLLNSDELVQKSYDAYFNKLKYEKRAEEHEQLAEWLEELKSLREAKELWEYNNNLAYQQGKTDTINEFAEKLKSQLEEWSDLNYQLSRKPYHEEEYGRYRAYDCAIDLVDEIADQLKEGVKNVNTSNSKEE